MGANFTYADSPSFRRSLLAGGWKGEEITPLPTGAFVWVTAEGDLKRMARPHNETDWHVALAMALDIHPGSGVDIPDVDSWSIAVDAVMNLADAEADLAEARAHANAALSSSAWGAVVGEDWADFAYNHRLPPHINEKRYHRGCRTGAYVADAWRCVGDLRPLIATGGRKRWHPKHLTNAQRRNRAAERIERGWRADSSMRFTPC